MAAPSTGTEREQGYPRPPAAPSAGAQGPAPGSNGPAAKAKGRRPVQYPVQLKVNISPRMDISLKRICQRLGIPEGIAARIAIAQFVDFHERGQGGPSPQ